MNLRFLLREIQHGKNQAAVFVLCVALSLVSIVAVNSFRRNIRQSVTSDAKALHGGDIIVHSHYDFSKPLQQELDTLGHEKGIQVVRTWEFYSVARRADGRDSLFCNIKAVQSGYPLYGVVELRSGRSFAEVLQPGRAIVAPELLQRLHLSLGDQILLGESAFTLVDVVSRESLRPVDFFSFGPRIFVSATDLGKMDLVKKGSRVQYNALLKITGHQLVDSIADRLRQTAVAGQERVSTSATAGSRVKRFFDNLLFFLSLISIFTLLLAGIGMQSSLAAMLRQKERSFAILRSLGATGGFLLKHYLLLVFILSLVGCFLGVLTGLLLEQGFSSLFAGLLPDKVALGGSPADVLEGMLLGLSVAGFFTFLPLSSIKNVKPAAVFRKEYAVGRNGRTRAVLTGCGIILLTGLVVHQLADLRIGLYFIGGIFGLVVVVSILVGIMLFLLGRASIRSLPLRQAVRSLLRPGNATRAIVVTMACALSVLLAIYLVEQTLRGTYIASYPAGAPNLFCLDIQKDQQQDFRKMIGPEAELFPIIRARLISINGRKIDRQKERNKRGDSLAREFNLTYRQKLLKDEVIAKGSTLFGKPGREPGAVPVSILDTVADLGDMKLGDRLLFNVQGVPIEARVTSIRSRTESMLYPFFYFVFREKDLAAAPQTFFAALNVARKKIPQLENNIVNRFPNISTINVSETAAELGKIMHKLSGIINFFASFSLLAGALILVSSVLATRLARVREAVYYKVLGADSRFVLRVFFLENLLLALLSGGCAILVAQTGSWGLCHYLFKIAYDPSWPANLVMLAATAFLVITLGLLSSVSILRQKPVVFLREQG